jgi:hypothetical protein
VIHLRFRSTPQTETAAHEIFREVPELYRKALCQKNGCLVYKTNFDYGMSVGTTYLGKIIKSAGKLPLIVLSHLDRASQATDDDFGIDISMLVPVDFDTVKK